jgi:CRP-like cAMP-binding protein
MDAADIAKLPLFGELDHHDLSRLAALMRTVDFPEGADLMEQDQIPRELFVIKVGTVGVVHDGLLIAELGPGDVVGEIGLVDPQRRTATVTARSAVHAVALDFEGLETLETEMPEVVRDLRALARRRLEELGHA